MAQSRSIKWPAITYLLALAVPAFWMGGDMVFGFKAILLSFLGVLLSIAEWNPLLLVQCVAGLLANAFILFAFAMGDHVDTSLRNGRKALVCAIVSIIALVMSGDFFPFIGCGLWLATMVQLALRPEIADEPATEVAVVS